LSWGAVQRNQSISYLKPARTRHYEKKKLTEATLPHSHRCRPRRKPSKRSHSHAPRRTSRGARRAPGRQSDSCSNNVQVAATLSTPTSTETGLGHAHQPARTIGTSPKRRGSPAHCTSGSRSPAASQRRTQREAQRSSPAPSPNRSGRLTGCFCEDPTNHAGNATVTQNACRSRASLSAGKANPQAPTLHLHVIQPSATGLPRKRAGHAACRWVADRWRQATGVKSSEHSIPILGVERNLG
jgi:hypothetical protein